jgi:large subunit ribosomal protein L30
MARKIKVTLKRGLAGSLTKHRKTVKALGLTRIGTSRIHTETDPIKGMVFQTKHLVDVVEVQD